MEKCESFGYIYIYRERERERERGITLSTYESRIACVSYFFFGPIFNVSLFFYFLISFSKSYQNFCFYIDYQCLSLILS